MSEHEWLRGLTLYEVEVTYLVPVLAKDEAAARDVGESSHADEIPASAARELHHPGEWHDCLPYCDSDVEHDEDITCREILDRMQLLKDDDEAEAKAAKARAEEESRQGRIFPEEKAT